VALIRTCAAEHRLQKAGCIRRRSFDDKRTRAGQERICGTRRGIASDNERCRADEAAQRFAEHSRHHSRRVTERRGCVVEELYVQVLPATFESHEQEIGAPVENSSGKAGGHGFEAGHTD